MMIRAIPAISNPATTMIPIVSVLEIPPELLEVLGAATVRGAVLVDVVGVVVVWVSAGVTLAPVALAPASAGASAGESKIRAAAKNGPRAR